MVFFGSSIFKIVRLVVIAAFSVHFFACMFYRVKQDSNDSDTVADFYLSKNADPQVSPSRTTTRVHTATRAAYLLGT